MDEQSVISTDTLQPPIVQYLDYRTDATLDAQNKDHLIILENHLDERTIYVSTRYYNIDPNMPIVWTHYGIFHIDEVISVAILLLSKYAHTPKIHIIRNRNVKLMNRIADVALDVGGVYDPVQNRFDHHQSSFNVKYRDGTFYATAGLVWLSYGSQAIQHVIDTYVDKQQQFLDESQLIQFVYHDLEAHIKNIDNVDNGQKISVSLANIRYTHIWVGGLNPIKLISDNSPTEYNKGFSTAVFSMYHWLKNRIIKSIALYTGLEYINYVEKYGSELDTTSYLIIPYDLPWRDLLWKKWTFFSKYDFIIVRDSISDRWCVYNTPVNPNTVSVYKVNVPEELRGKSQREIEEFTGISDIIQIHRSGYVTYVKTKTAAIRFIEYLYSTYKDSLYTPSFSA